jgi:hypothetical protein
MDLAKILALFKRKPKMRPIYVDGKIVGYDDGLPNSINIDKSSIRKALTSYGTDDYGFMMELLAMGLASYDGDQRIFTRRAYADKSIFVNYGNVGGVSTGGAYIQARSKVPVWYTGTRGATYYWCCVETARTTDDLGLYKTVAGSYTRLGGWATDISPDSGTTLLDLCTKGTTIEVWTYNWSVLYDWLPNKRPNEITGSSLRIQVTDTSIADGCFGWLTHGMRYGSFTSDVSYWPNAWTIYSTGILRLPSSSPSIEPIAYFEVPVEEFDLPEVDEEGNINVTTKYYGIRLPQEIAEVRTSISELQSRRLKILMDKGFSEDEASQILGIRLKEKVNRLAVTYHAFIPTDSKGKPASNTAIVKISESTPEYCHPIEKRMQAIKEMRGVRRLSREEAIDLALKMDDKLHIHDLVPCTKHELGGKCFREYREWRIGTVGDKPEFADTDIRKHYVKDVKGW